MSTANSHSHAHSHAHAHAHPLALALANAYAVSKSYHSETNANATSYHFDADTNEPNTCFQESHKFSADAYINASSNDSHSKLCACANANTIRWILDHRHSELHVEYSIDIQ
jgi:hypothetical protein